MSNGQPDASQIRIKLTHIYDAYRTALLNKKYYGRKLSTYKTINIVFEWIIVAGATGSGISGFALWETSNGKEVWSVIAGVSVILATLKPLLNIGESIKVYTALFIGHGKIYRNLEYLIEDINYYQKFTEEMNKIFMQAQNGFEDLDQHDDPRPNMKLLRQFQAEVNREIPVANLWMPA